MKAMNIARLFRAAEFSADDCDSIIHQTSER